MRVTKLTLMFGLLSLAIYGCGDSGGSSKKPDSGQPTGTTTTTKTSTSTTTPTGTSTSTTTPTGTATQTSIGGDGGANPDTSIGSPADGGGSTDGGTTTPGVDGGGTKIDGGAGVDGGGTKIDTGAAVDGGGKDTSAGSDGAQASDAPSTGSCVYPQCYVDVAQNCAPSGACVMQSTSSGTSSTSNICYDNGIKMQIASTFTIDLGTMTFSGTTVDTFKGPSGVCYSLETPYSTTTLNVITYTMKNASGTPVATVVLDNNAGTQTITCAGGAPVVLPLNCGSSNADAGTTTSPACTTGSCTF